MATIYVRTYIRARKKKPSPEREGLGAGYPVALITRILSRIHQYSGTIAANGGSIAENSGSV